MRVALAIVFLAGVHGTELALVVDGPPGGHKCGCATDCACRGPDHGCGCSRAGPSIKGRCGCGGSEQNHQGTAPSWDTVLAPACSLGAPLLVWSAVPARGDSQAWRLPYEHERPPESLS